MNSDELKALLDQLRARDEPAPAPVVSSSVATAPSLAPVPASGDASKIFDILASLKSAGPSSSASAAVPSAPSYDYDYDLPPADYVRPPSPEQPVYEHFEAPMAPMPDLHLDPSVDRSQLSFQASLPILATLSQQVVFMDALANVSLS